MSADETTNPVRIAVAGLGKMGIMHAAMVTSIPGAEVVAVVDPDAGACRQLQTMLPSPTPRFASVGECLARARPDGVIVSTPQFTHRAVAEACLRAGVGVLCEKPLAHTLEDARAMLGLSRSLPGVPAGIGFMLGHHPLFNEAREIVAAGTIGRVISARGSCRLSQVFAPNKGWTFNRGKAGGGVVINSGSHLLFALHHIMGPARRVVARGSPVHNEVEDTFGALIDFESGAWGVIDISWSVPGYEFQTHDIVIEGTNGTLEVGNQWLRLHLIREHGAHPKGWSQKRRDECEPRAPVSLSPDYFGDEFRLEDLDFVGALRGKRQPRIGWDTGLEIQILLDAIYRSMDSGESVTLRRDGAE